MSGLPLIRPLISEFHQALRREADKASEEIDDVIAVIEPLVHEPTPTETPAAVAATANAVAIDEEPRTIKTTDAKSGNMASHRFEDGWCADCGISEEVGARWTCETIEVAQPRPRVAQSMSRSMHDYGNGNRCRKCGMRRDVANSPYCAAR